MSDRRYSVRKEVGSIAVRITDRRTGMHKTVTAQNMVRGQLQYDPTNGEFPDYVHADFWNEWKSMIKS